MKRNERLNDETIAALSMLEGWQAGIYTCLPVQVVAVSLGDGGKMTVDVQPTIQAQFTKGKERAWVTLPVLPDCPVQFPQGGGFTLTFPIKPGDEGIVVFSSRCLDAWWQLGGVQVQYDLRMHDLSDGFYIPGVRSQPRALSVDADNVQLRTDAGNALIEITPAGVINITTDQDLNVTTTGDVVVSAGGNADVTAGGEIKLTAPSIKLIGNVDLSGGYVKHNGVAIGSTHKHTSSVGDGANHTGNPG